ncbi:hypothetical protein [Capillibacterium thermochitinicola]|uniref:Outer membrane protein beta-barrel domain-containing protein n=1 Tax=Capillibacterium thermochitinicola TaxID=2699427 RepID=A0A8J6LHV3_9FIRM|nr:hypothetical protein [Capillibacterium thermochitinicola]MBA2132605.1 hypothetical protein [Capillibacterium thermochitinicola]
MKKAIRQSLKIMVFCLSILLLSSSTALAEDNIFKVGYLAAGKVTTAASGSEAKFDLGGSVAFWFERALEINEDFELGYGVALQLSGEFEEDDDYYSFHEKESICFPFFLLLNYYPLTIEGLPYLTGHFGYNLMLYDDGDNNANLHGLYYALGAGIRLPGYPNVRAEVLYTANSGSGTVVDVWDDTSEKVKVSLSRICLNVGFGF